MSKYNELGISIAEFIKGYWSARMKEVAKPKGLVDLEDLAGIKEVGVVLDDNIDIPQ